MDVYAGMWLTSTYKPAYAYKHGSYLAFPSVEPNTEARPTDSCHEYIIARINKYRRFYSFLAYAYTHECTFLLFLPGDGYGHLGS